MTITRRATKGSRLTNTEIDGNVDHLLAADDVLTQAVAAKVSTSAIVNNLTGGGAAVPLSAAQGVVLKGLVDAKAEPQAPADITNASILTVAANGQRQNRYSGSTMTLAWPSDAGSGDLSAEFVELPGSPGHLTVTTPDGKSVTTSQSYTVGFTRKGVNLYDIGPTSTGTSTPMTGSAISDALDAQLGSTAWRTPLTGSAIAASLDTALGGSAWRGGTMTGTAIVAAIDAALGGSTWRDGAPVLLAVLSAAVGNSNPSLITLTLNGAATSADPTGAGGITLASDIGGAITVTAVDVSGSSILLTTSRPIVFGEVITRSYNSAASSTPFASASGSMANFTSQAVTNNVAASGGGAMARTSIVSQGFTDATSGTSPATTVAPSGVDRAVFGAVVGVKGFGVVTISDIKFGGSGGTSLVALGAAQGFNSASASIRAYGYAPGPNANTTMYALMGDQTGNVFVHGAFFSGMSQTTPWADYTPASGVDGNAISSITASVTVPNTVSGQLVVAAVGFSSLSASCSGFTPVAGTTIVPDSIEVIGLGGSCLLQKTATGTSTTLSVTCDHTSAAGMSWGAIGARGVPA